MTRTVAAVVLGIAALLGGCSTDSVLGPASAPDGGPAPVVAKLSASAWIGPAGGVLQSDGAVVTIPVGALLEPVEVRLVTSVVNGHDRVEIYPDALSLAAQYSLSMAKSDCSTTYGMRVWDPVAATWSALKAADLGGILVARPIQFSRFEIIETDQDQ